MSGEATSSPTQSAEGDRPAREHRLTGKYAANAAWAACAVIAFNLARATAVAASMRTARWATVRTRSINIPARIAATGRRLILHLPQHWPWSSASRRSGSALERAVRAALTRDQDSGHGAIVGVGVRAGF